MGFILTGWVVWDLYYLETVKIPDIYEHEVIVDKDKYDEVVKYEDEKGYYYPSNEVEKILVYPYHFPIGKRITKDNIKKITNLLNNPKSYIWGELGTPEFHKRIVFYDKDNNLVGITNFSYEGQTRSYPRLNRMKWGMLKPSSKDLLISIIEE